MYEHLTPKQVEDYCWQQLRVVDLLSVSDHLDECEACRQRIEYAINGDAAFLALRSEVFGEAAEISSPHLVGAHLSSDQTAGYVDKILTSEELQMVADHLSSCEQCALAIDDLQVFRDQIAPSLEREYHPPPVALQTEGLWQRTVASLSVLFRVSPGLAFGTALAVILLTMTGWLIWPTQPQSELKQEIVVSPPHPSEPAPLTEPASPSEPAPVPVVAQLKDGEGQLTLDQEGKLLGAGHLPLAYQSMLKEALTTRRIERSSQLKGLARPPSSLMSADKQKNEFSVIEPVGKVVMSDQPTIRWSKMEGASVYVVEVYDSKFNLVATSRELTEHSWAPPALSRGKLYTWQVKAIKDGEEFRSPRPPAAQARFRILDQGKTNELAKARRAYSSSHLTLGLLYAEAGLLKEAEQELRALEKANPDSEIAHSLFSQIQALRRRSE